jgi:hypothetical protein
VSEQMKRRVKWEERLEKVLKDGRMGAILCRR